MKEEKMTKDELSKKLEEMWGAAPPREKTPVFHLFGIRYAKELAGFTVSDLKEISVGAGQSASMGHEIHKGRSLGPYVTERPDVVLLPYPVSMLRFHILKLVSLEHGISSHVIRDRICKVFEVTAEEIRDERSSMRSDKLIDYGGGSLRHSNTISEKGKKLLSDIEAHLSPSSPLEEDSN